MAKETLKKTKRKAAKKKSVKKHKRRIKAQKKNKKALPYKALDPAADKAAIKQKLLDAKPEDVRGLCDAMIKRGMTLDQVADPVKDAALYDKVRDAWFAPYKVKTEEKGPVTLPDNQPVETKIEGEANDAK